MNRSSQAGIELLIVMSFVIIITTLMSSVMLSYNLDNIFLSRSDAARANCERFSYTVSNLAKLNGLESGFYNNYNMSIDAGLSLALVYYEDGEIFCRLQTKQVINSTGSYSFNMSGGSFLLKNLNGTVRVNKV